MCTAQSASSDVAALIDAHWRYGDGIIEEDEEAAVDLYHLPSGAARQFVGERPSAYGEVAPCGAPTLFDALGLPLARGACFYDLGSGSGRLVANVWLSHRSDAVARAVGVELAPSRHAAATRAWASLAASGSPLLGERRAPPHFRCESMLETDLSDATHVYVASLCMGDGLLDALWARLREGAPRLARVASLREFRGVPATQTVEVQMTWNRDAGAGTPVYLYDVN